MNKNIYIVGIGGIGTSGLARYYKSIGYTVYGSDSTNSELIKQLKTESIECYIGERPEIFEEIHFEKVIYSAGVPPSQKELQKAKELNITLQSYPEALGELANAHKLITISGTHGKSTTTSMAAIMLKNSKLPFSSIIGTLLTEFNKKNQYSSGSYKADNNDIFLIEACEYKRHFLNYHPYIAIITNIELDHLDYFKDEQDYLSAYKSLVDNIQTGGFLIIDGQEKNSLSLNNIRSDISTIVVYNDYFIVNNEKYTFPKFDLQVPGRHILYDAKLVYVIGFILKINGNTVIDSLQGYKGVWRRMEKIKTTLGGNLLMSDYGHHPTEVKKTLLALKQANPEKHILTVFQPHQYSRTLELLEDFITCFSYTDSLIIPNIYESRDSEEDKGKINTQKFVTLIQHDNVVNGNGFEQTLKYIQDFDSKNTNAIILLLGAGDIDTLRYSID